MNDPTYSARLVKLEDFLRANSTDEWKWAEVYDVLSISQEERPAFRRRLAREWTAGQLPWLQMSVQRGRGGVGGLRLCKDSKAASSEHPLVTLWKRMHGPKAMVSTGFVKRLVEAAVVSGSVKGVTLQDLEDAA